ncbi:MAG: type II 3-dehydroquinate dehydratase [Candidatus Aminicenantes bacterium]
MPSKILVINGPNMNLLGHRETEIYGSMSLDDMEKSLKEMAGREKSDIDFFQSNFEGEILEKLHQARGRYQGIIINPAGLSHTSYPLLDAIRALEIPVIEVHISNIFARGENREKSLTASACRGVICGMDWRGYLYALLELTKGDRSV